MAFCSAPLFTINIALPCSVPHLCLVLIGMSSLVRRPCFDEPILQNGERQVQGNLLTSCRLYRLLAVLTFDDYSYLAPCRKPQMARPSRPADASSSTRPTLATSSSTGDLQSLLQGFAGGARPLYPVEPSASASRRTPGRSVEPDARAAPPPDYIPTQLPGDVPEYDSDGEEIVRPKSSQHGATPSRNVNQVQRLRGRQTR